jgi:hypothetical protein
LAKHLIDLSPIRSVCHTTRTAEMTQPVQANPRRRRSVKSGIGSVAAPSIPLQLTLEPRRYRFPFVLRSDRVEMDVLDQFPRVGVFLDQMGFETALEQVSASAMPPIEPDAVSGLQPPSGGAEVGAGCLQQ